MHYVYILKSEKDNRRYIGCASNIEKRLAAHNAGDVISTKNRRPLKVVYFEEVSSLSEARKREMKLKSLKGGDVIEKLISSFKWSVRE